MATFASFQEFGRIRLFWSMLRIVLNCIIPFIVSGVICQTIILIEPLANSLFNDFQNRQIFFNLTVTNRLRLHSPVNHLSCGNICIRLRYNPLKDVLRMIEIPTGKNFVSTNSGDSFEIVDKQLRQQTIKLLPRSIIVVRRQISIIRIMSI